MEIKLENSLNAEEYNYLREQIGWKKHDLNRVKIALENSEYVKKAVADNKIVGMARVISDGLYALIVDVIVSPDYQNMGIGKQIINSLLSDIEASLNTGETISVTLISMAGKESFYEKCGFHKVPLDYTGYGMQKKISK